MRFELRACQRYLAEDKYDHAKEHVTLICYALTKCSSSRTNTKKSPVAERFGWSDSQEPGGLQRSTDCSGAKSLLAQLPGSVGGAIGRSMPFSRCGDLFSGNRRMWGWEPVAEGLEIDTGMQGIGGSNPRVSVVNPRIDMSREQLHGTSCSFFSPKA